MRLSDEGKTAPYGAPEAQSQHSGPAPPDSTAPAAEENPVWQAQRQQSGQASVRRPPPGGRTTHRMRRSAPRERQLPYIVVLCGLVAALLWMVLGGQNARGGTLAVAGIVLAAALARLMLPESRAGMLVTRSRLADVVILTALGAGVLAAGLVLPAQS